MKKDNVFWGLLLIAAAVYILVSSMGLAPDISVMRVIIAIICVVTLVNSLVKISFGGILFSAAVLLIVFDEALGITDLTPWPVLGAALLGSIGLNLIFGKQVKRFRGSKNQKRYAGMGSTHTVKGDDIDIHGSFNGYQKKISSGNFTGGRISCRFGGMEINFDDAVIQSGSATLLLDIAFSGLELYVPKSWEIHNQAECFAGSIEEHSSRTGEDGDVSSVLVLEGNVRFSGVEIYRI